MMPRESPMRPMLALMFALMFALMLASGSVHAQSSQCGFITDPDLQAMCRAQTGSGASQCGFIRNPDMQAACRAQTAK